MEAYYSQEPFRADLDEVRRFIERGRRNYDLLAKEIYTMCSKNDDVMKRVLDAVDHIEQNVNESGTEFTESGEESEASEEIEESEESQASEESEEEPIKPVSKITKRKRSASPSKVKDSPKRKKQNLGKKKLRCLNCDAKFNPAENKENSCHYHPGESVLGELEDNPTCDEIEDDWPSRQTWPNAFDWVCCEQNLEEDDYDGGPCAKGRHRAEGEKLDFAIWQEKKVDAV